LSFSVAADVEFVLPWCWPLHSAGRQSVSQSVSRSAATVFAVPRVVLPYKETPCVTNKANVLRHAVNWRKYLFKSRLIWAVMALISYVQKCSNLLYFIFAVDCSYRHLSARPCFTIFICFCLKYWCIVSSVFQVCRCTAAGCSWHVVSCHVIVWSTWEGHVCLWNRDHSLGNVTRGYFEWRSVERVILLKWV
jgi:hypothetical protein